MKKQETILNEEVKSAPKAQKKRRMAICYDFDHTLSPDDMQTFIPGIQTLDALSFTANYTKADYSKVKALEGVEHEYAIWMGGTKNIGAAPTPTGTEGKYAFSGQASVYINGGGVNEVTDMTITIAASTPIAPADEA